MDLLEEVWRLREDVIYPRWFGSTGAGIYVLRPDLFMAGFGQESIDPRWLHHGVFQCPPGGGRRTWIYVSSGLSNPWERDAADDSEAQYSGLGVEFVMETPDEAPWAIELVQRMVAYNILLSRGRLGAYPVLAEGDRIPLRASITPDPESAIRNLVITRPEHYPASFVLPSGRVEFLHFIGITDPELAFAKASTSDALVQRLKESGVYPVTDPRRASVL